VNADFDRIPIVDISGLGSADLATRRAVAAEMGAAAREVGFLYVRGHGLDEALFEDVLAGVRAGEAAGADVAVITATHAHPLETSHPTIASYEQLRVEFDGARGLRIKVAE